MEATNLFSAASDIKVVHLADWLNWAGGKGDEQFIALPMIQRGSVWKPHQITDLWDSLLQGMPIGSMMVSELKEGTPVRRPGKPQRELVQAGGGLALIDGQQRTLAMLAAWPRAVEMDRRVWIDFAEAPAAGQLLRLRVTTVNQPFGFRLDAPSRKLSLDDRRTARSAFIGSNGEQAKPGLDNARPFSHKPGLPVDLRQLIDLWLGRSSREAWCNNIEETLGDLKAARFIKGDPGEWRADLVWPTLTNPARVIERVSVLADALSRLDDLEMPLIRVHARFFETASTEFSDPPLAVLFKRIGTGGTPLSDADYVYSVIKHLRPETHDLVEGLHSGEERDKTVASLLTATDLVMSAVRLAAVNWTPMDGRPVPDMANPSKQDFHRLLLRGDFIGAAFMPLIQGDGQKPVIARHFSKVQAMLAYRGSGDTGLPKQAFPLLNRPLVQVLLLLAQVGYFEDEIARREDVLRLVLFWLVAVTDPLKASRLAYEVIKEKTVSAADLGSVIHERLIAGSAAVRLPAPEEIIQLGLACSPKDAEKIRGESRFDATKHNQEGHSRTYAFYRSHWWRPWTHQHPILLWLQREMVAAKLDEEADPMAGKDEDTPYDYDHILPVDHWGGWTGVRRGNTLLDFADQGQIHVVGNSIGNIRVWASSLNRSDGSSSPEKKLKLDTGLDGGERNLLLKYSAIEPDQIENWIIASGTADQHHRSWSRERALAFQRAVEGRAANLYRDYYDTMGFSKWR